MPHIPRLVCEPCNIEMRPLKNDVTAEAMIERGPHYKIQCDRWECETCGRTVLSGFAEQPLSRTGPIGYADPPATVRFTFRS